jgi:hypothetical protein
MTLCWPIAEVAQGRREPIYEPDHVFRASRAHDRRLVVAAMRVLEGFKTPEAHRVAIERSRISLSHSAII